MPFTYYLFSPYFRKKFNLRCLAGVYVYLSVDIFAVIDGLRLMRKIYLNIKKLKNVLTQKHS